MKKLCQMKAILFLLIFYSHTIFSAVVIGPNGNGYEYVSYTDITWSDAKTAAEVRSYNSVNGHLATVFSSEENNFILGILAGVDASAWLGGTDSAIEGQWKWLSGEVFWQGGISGTVGPDALYANWQPGLEPNNSGPHGSENYLSIYGAAVPIGGGHDPGYWNDLQNAPLGNSGAWSIGGYVVEYELSQIPLPPALWLFATGLLGLVGAARRNRDS